MFGVFQVHALVQGLSLDEAFLDVTGSQELWGGALEIARRVSAASASSPASASVGVAPQQLVANIAHDENPTVWWW